jgi:hypothetical protein
MRPDERIAVGDLAGDGFAGLVGTARDTHRAIAGRVFDAIGEGARPVAVVHDAIADVAYGSARAGGRSLASAAGRVAARRAGPDAQSLDRRPALRITRAAIGGLWGDRLAARRSALAIPMAVRVDGRDLALERSALAVAFPGATVRVAVFLHGLGEADDAWQLRREGRPSYGQRLAGELGFTPVYVRYNSGLHISENGRRLAALLDSLVAEWPVPVSEIALIGHSMGGLVARSACHYGEGSRWFERVSSLVMLGTPHTGAPLARGAQRLEEALSVAPETRALARALGQRSSGIKDLDRGYLTDECWRGQDDGPGRRYPARQVPFPEHVRHYHVAASLGSATGDDLLSRTLGDLLVARDSAWGRSHARERLRFAADRYLHLGGADHFDLLSHPAIADQLVRWLAEPHALPPGRGERADQRP